MRVNADNHPPPPPGDLAGLYDAYSPAVYRLALRLCRNSAAAEDLVQDVFLRYWRQERYRWQLLQRWSSQLLGGHQRSPHQRQVLELAYYEGMSQSGIAEHLQIPLGTVKTRSRQGLLALRRHLHDFTLTPLPSPTPLAEGHGHH
ncbi:MAG: hypothetical protein K0U63_10395 [Cyanobacteria bacterium]|nr:hypothetical protein [Cyanobacteriota bacterium]